jgi:D-alanine-D-alanine ligase
VLLLIILQGDKMKICVLQSDYSQSSVAFKHKVSIRNLSDLLPTDQIDHVFLTKATLYRQLKDLSKQGYDIFVNLCQGYRDWDIPSCYEVTLALEDLNLPYTGPTKVLYDMPKNAMKNIAFFAGVETPAFVVAETLFDAEIACHELKFPLFVKPTALGDSLGIDQQSYVSTRKELLSKVTETIANWDTALIEEYIPGREFTVLLLANPDDHQMPIIYKPIELLFSPEQQFGTLDLTPQHQPRSYVACDDQNLDLRLRDAARRVFLEINQGGYARCDFRVDQEGEIYFLEINSPCPVFYPRGRNALADYVLQANQISPSEFLKQTIAEGIARHQRRQKKYQLKQSPIATYGIFAVKDLMAGEIIVPGEAKFQRVVTQSYIQSHWTGAEREAFLRYAYRLTPEVFVLRNANPATWLSQNHSCDPNTAYQGLDLVATRDVEAGEELTLDFASFRGENMMGFECQCGSSNCRGSIRFASCCATEEQFNFSHQLACKVALS